MIVSEGKDRCACIILPRNATIGVDVNGSDALAPDPGLLTRLCGAGQPTIIQ